ncbi:N-alpha-acetyl diaminobutyric acid deacetylase DoeB [Roseobacter denitrificans]|uniref:Succinylglutamate desuccinylase/Aspartoacylase catalytic domain-containing protein n=1 Tax=Roseobacter denitrificans (strain ATCC 33942 / OCh 114) TaxID=375451 RepID=Q162Y3_ROSDO|nr:N(2)-acetyl-L-2,4-diaminobutanoate deacetylase DoeB [Roseobacter denitrificans]ABG32960.1 conserved hypothetical protein [Roseobacter denitrificans OCh 114]AVL52347.1 N-alpha-acetyl diaminobutyric acid deacetylase DoeB [Roseobacter denitrificans]SFG10462.1 N-alpha-acetyl-L-2,4-diaminobutyrate deacetylase [Roseobacter denitrificans OCh 114]
MGDTAVHSSVDFNAEGVQHGHLRLPHSRDDSAWGSILTPICVIKNGAGPTALLSGGNHGDEYEGPIALHHLARDLAPHQINGRVIILPSMSHPAFLAGTRTSPVDGVNMNRAFPGRVDGSPTQKMADYVQRILLPMADVVLDFHSGGKTLNFLPFAASHILENKEQEARCRAARDAFNAPYSLEMREIDARGMYDHAAESQGKTFVTTELAGGGTATPETVRIARDGLRNLLIHAGIMEGTPSRAPSIQLTQPDDACFHFAQTGGLVDFKTGLGQQVACGDLIAEIWEPGATGRVPLQVLAQRSGLMIARHHPGLIQPGDCLAVLAVQVDA